MHEHCRYWPTSINLALGIRSLVVFIGTLLGEHLSRLYHARWNLEVIPVRLDIDQVIQLALGHLDVLNRVKLCCVVSHQELARLLARLHWVMEPRR